MPELGLFKQPLLLAHSDPMVLMTTSPLAAVDPQVGVEEGALIPSVDSSSKEESQTYPQSTGQVPLTTPDSICFAPSLPTTSEQMS